MRVMSVLGFLFQSNESAVVTSVCLTVGLMAVVTLVMGAQDRKARKRHRKKR
ncbi:hypothetical protein [Streptomyces sp. NPDC017260]|uniref:hypothetical protein n=1 Tax=unclassified Streptomyces TaxID=2593676 RepID=UPI0037B916D5